MYYRIWVDYDRLRKSGNSAVKLLLDRIFSQYMRRSAADVNGYASCYTCGATKQWYELENGHYVDRQHMCTRYHPQNNHPQCHYCNATMDGNTEVYKANLDRDYGEGTAEKLEALGRMTCKISRVEMIEMIEKLDKKIGELING